LPQPQPRPLLTDPTTFAGWPDGYDCQVLDSVDSTMREAARQADTLTAPKWIMARQQTDARGRHGRKWSNPDGNLAATLVFHPKCSPMAAAQQSFLAANALYETFYLYTGHQPLSLKWPNDVLLDGGKVAGILLESSARHGMVDWLSIGFGVNLGKAPEDVTDAAFPPVSLAGNGRHRVDPNEFLLYLAKAYVTQEQNLARHGFERIRKDWMAQAARLGQTITARMPQETVEGRFETIDADGNLVLFTAAGRRVIAAADIHF